MATIHDADVISLRSRSVDRGEQRALADLRQLLLEADDALAAVLDRDVDSVFRLHRLVTRAVTIVIDHRLATSRDWRPSA